MYKVYDQTILREHRESLMERFPYAFESPENTRMLLYLIRGMEGFQEGWITIPHKLLARIYGVTWRNFASGRTLEEFFEGMNLAFELKSYCIGEGKAREIKVEWPREIEEVLLEDLETPLDGSVPLVYFLSGNAYNFNRYRPYLEKQLQADEMPPLEVGRLNTGIMTYLRSLNIRDYSGCLKNIPRAQEEIQERYTNPAARKSQLDVLRSIHSNPLPLYTQVPTTDRIYSRNSCLQNLNKASRQILIPNSMSFDVKSCHLAIIADAWRIPLLRQILGDGCSPWKYLADHMGLQLSDETKAILKEAIYSVTYGGSKWGVRQRSKWSQSQTKRFYDCDLVKAILEKRDQRLYRIKKDQGITIEGVFHPLKKTGEERSLLARSTQAIEVQIISGAYECAEDHRSEFTIVSHEHDGFSIKVKKNDRISSIENNLKNAIRRKGKLLGMMVELEVASPFSYDCR